MRVLVAPDKFRGTASAAEAAAALGSGVRASGHVATELPLADGGEGLLDVLGGANRLTDVIGPLGEPLRAGWQLDGRRAVIEMARASGLELVGGPSGNDAVAASTRGTGQLIAAAIEAGARRIVVGLGGSATTDGGLGAIEAIPLARLRGVELIVACDVRVGFVAAAEVFASQKGATPAQARLLRRRLEAVAADLERRFGVDVTQLERAGAAGGLAGGLAALGARLVSGFDLVVDELDVVEAVESCELVITGEGHLDPESFDGKVVGGMCELADQAGVPVLIVVGGADAGVAADREVVVLNDSVGTERARRDTIRALAEVIEHRFATRP